MRKWIALVSLGLLTAVRSHGAQADADAAARPAGMAEAFTALADDASAVLYNPAGLAQLRSLEAVTQRGELARGFTDGSDIVSTSLGFAQPLRGGRWGTVGVNLHEFKGAGFFRDRDIYLGYGKMFAPLAGGRWAAGVTLKQLRRSYDPDRYADNALNDAGVVSGRADPLFGHGRDRDDVGADLGVLYRFGESERVSLGAAVINARRADLSLAGAGDKRPRVTKIGFGFRPGLAAMALEVRRAERTSRMDTEAAVGAEKTFSIDKIGSLALRGGYARGSRGMKTVSAGASFKLTAIQLDYAFLFPVGNMGESNGSHRVALSFRPDPPRVELSRAMNHAWPGTIAARTPFVQSSGIFPSTKRGSCEQKSIRHVLHRKDLPGRADHHRTLD